MTNEIRFRISEFNNRPKAIKELLGSLNLTEVFQKQLKLMPQSSEIYSEKDIKDLEKVTNEVTVSCILLFYLLFLYKGDIELVFGYSYILTTRLRLVWN